MDNRSTALAICRKLQASGHEAFLVGGCVRDIVLGRDPKDFDITTNALPEQVAAIFPNTIPVGAKFGVTVVIENQDSV
jgi:tRNA nucleotidyltransferase/poly(A) polymerase